MKHTRLGIFVFYDKDGIVDDYIPHMLRDICSNLTELVVVCNGLLRPEGRAIFEQFTDKIYVRDNLGYDVMAYKLALTEYCGWDYVGRFDEVVLFNDTFFGPIGSFKNVFDKMEKSPVDFWGISRYYGGTGEQEEKEATHSYIQYYFIAFRKRMILSEPFQNYWNSINPLQWTYREVLSQHEWSFTKRMTDYGFTYDTYILASKYEFDKPELNIVQYFSVHYDLIKDYGFPIIKKKAFAGKNLHYSPGEDIRRTLDYIEENNLYDVSLIWQNILRIYNVMDIYHALHLEYVLSTTSAKPVKQNLDRLAVLVYLKDTVFWKDTKSYLTALADGIRIFLCTDLKENQLKEIEADGIPNKSIQVLQLSNQSVSEAFRGFMKWKDQFDFLCIIAPELEEANSAYERKLLHYLTFENTIANVEYFSNIISLFEKHPRLGFLSVPTPIHNNYFGSIGNEWLGCFHDTQLLAKELKLRSRLSEDVTCFGNSLAFWCKVDAIQPLFDYALKYSASGVNMEYGNTVWNRIYPYVAQDRGYYSGTVMSERYASYRLNTLEYTLADILEQYRRKGEISDLQSVKSLEAIQYASNKRHLYIFGTGGHAEEAIALLEQQDIKIFGFLISDDQIKSNGKENRPIYSLSQAPFDPKQDGILVAIHKRYYAKVLPELREKGYSYVVW